MKQYNPISFKILAMAPFHHPAKNNGPKCAIAVNAMALDSVMAELKPNFKLPLPQTLCPKGGIEITCSWLQDFHPDSLARNTPLLRHLLEARGFLEKARASNKPQREIKDRLNQWPDLPELTQGLNILKSDPASQPLDRLLELVDLPREISTSTIKNTRFNGNVETIIQKTFEAIFQHQPFKSAEAAWLGLNLLLQKKTGHKQVTVYLASASRDTLQETLNRLLPEMIDKPPTLIVVDLPFSNSARDLELIKAVATFSETLLAPSLLWIGPEFFHLKTWNDLNKRPYLPHFLETTPYAKWRSLKQTDMANWLIVTCNCFVLRYPYGPHNKPSLLDFEETGLPWLAPVWAIADLIVQSHLKTGWPTRFTDWQRFRVDGLAMQSGSTGRYPTETIFSMDRADQLIRSGITPLIGIANRDFVCTPMETSLGGRSIGDQIYLSIIIDYIIKLHESGQIDSKDDMLENDIRKSLIQFLGASLEPTADALYVSTGPVDSNGRFPLAIRILPEGTIPPLRHPIELTFSW